MRKTHRETPLLRPGMTPSLRAQMQDQVENRNVEPQKKPEARPSLHIPVTSLRTSYELVRQRLLIYDR